MSGRRRTSPIQADPPVRALTLEQVVQLREKAWAIERDMPEKRLNGESQRFKSAYRQNFG